jgi:hypothetical protein
VTFVSFVYALASHAFAATIRCDPARGLAACFDAATAHGTQPGAALLPRDTRFELSSPALLYPRLAVQCEPGAIIASRPGAKLDALLRSGEGEQPDITITGCIFDGSRRFLAALKLMPGAGKLRRLRITGCTFRYTTEMAILGAGWDDAEIAYNEFHDTGRPEANAAALWLFAQSGASRNVRVHDNACDNSGIRTGCFKFTASVASPLDGIYITHNRVLPGDSPRDNTSGIELFAEDARAIRHFEISDNDVRGPNRTNERIFGISVGGAEDGIVLRNQVTDARAFGIELIGSRLAARDNVLTRSGPITWDAATASRTDVEITHNTVRDAAQRGIFFYAAHQHCLVGAVVQDNIIETPRGPAVRIQNSSGERGCGDAGGRDAIRNAQFTRNQITAGSADHPAFEVLGAARGITLSENKFASSTTTEAPHIAAPDDAEITFRGNEFDARRPLLRGERARVVDAGGNQRAGAAITMKPQ